MSILDIPEQVVFMCSLSPYANRVGSSESRSLALTYCPPVLQFILCRQPDLFFCAVRVCLIYTYCNYCWGTRDQFSIRHLKLNFGASSPSSFYETNVQRTFSTEWADEAIRKARQLWIKYVLWSVEDEIATPDHDHSVGNYIILFWVSYIAQLSLRSTHWTSTIEGLGTYSQIDCD